MDQNFPVDHNDQPDPNPGVNVDVPERILSVLTGSLLLYRSLSKGNFNLFRLAAAGYLLYRGSTGNDPIYAALGKERMPDPIRNINIRTSMTVNRPRAEVYAFWRKLENLPLFMEHLEKVTEIDNKHSHWVAKLPGGVPIEWDAEIVEEREGSFLGWNSLRGATVENAGKVEFKDVGQNWTELNVVISYRAPMGAAGHGLSRLLNPLVEKMVERDILSFKKYIERAVVTESIVVVENISLK
jgi:uncharacterized membrane protein